MTKDKSLFVWRESVTNGKSYWQLWMRGAPDSFVCNEKKLVKILVEAGAIKIQTKEKLENVTKNDEGQDEDFDQNEEAAEKDDSI